MDLKDKINKKIKELEEEIEDMKGSSAIVLLIPKCQLKILKEIIN